MAPTTEEIQDTKMSDQRATRQISHASQTVEDGHGNVDELTAITAKARDATEHEHQITTKHALRHYKKAIFWSLIVSMSIVMEAYDTLLIATFYAYPTFTRKFGEKVGDGYQMAPKWQAALSNGETVGLFFGCLLNGWLSDKFGRKLVMQGSYVFTAATLFMMFFAPNVEVLFGSVFLRGLPMGIFAIMGPTYACEVCPIILRSYLTGWVNICWVLGHIVGAALLRGLVDWNSEWAYRIPMAVQWLWVVPLFIVTLWCPESPWWLVRQGRHEDAKKSLRSLCSKQEQVNVDQTLAMMIHTYAYEEKQAETDGDWLDCFRGSNLRRTEVSIGGWGWQSVAGFAISAQSTFFFVQAGLKTGDAFWLTLGQYFVALTGNLLCYVLLHYFGRRPVYTWGYVGMFVVWFIVGCLGCAPSNNPNIPWVQGTLILVWFFVYSITIGPTAISIASETPAQHQRAKTIALSRNVYYIVTIVNNVATPYLINPTAANLKGKAAFIPAGLCLMGMVWSYYRLPECKGRTVEELDILFDRNVPARKFKNYVIEIEEINEEATLKNVAE